MVYKNPWTNTKENRGYTTLTNNSFELKLNTSSKMYAIVLHFDANMQNLQKKKSIVGSTYYKISTYLIKIILNQV